jgi:hypothetical protein
MLFFVGFPDEVGGQKRAKKMHRFKELRVLCNRHMDRRPPGHCEYVARPHEMIVFRYFFDQYLCSEEDSTLVWQVRLDG